MRLLLHIPVLIFEALEIRFIDFAACCCSHLMKSFGARKTQHATSSIRHVAKFIDFWPPLAEMKMFSQVLPDLLLTHTLTQSTCSTEQQKIHGKTSAFPIFPWRQLFLKLGSWTHGNFICLLRFLSAGSA